jgi:quercetin dioxygenase-like cupin family protein
MGGPRRPCTCCTGFSARSGSQSHLLQGSIHIIEPGGGSDGPLTHEGDEVGYVINGTIELTVGDAAHSLHAGDSFCFQSEKPHAYHNAGDTPARVIVINTPPTF